MELREACEADLPAIQAIYAYHVFHGLASFEEVPPGVEEMRKRRAEVADRGLPYLVAHDASGILGFGYCNLFRTRSAYRHTIEDSIYVREGLQGHGVGRMLLAALIARGTALGYRQMVAVIGDSGNAPSIGLHASLGFTHAGTLRATGFKFGRWVDTVMMQRALGPGDSTLPGPAGIGA